MDFRILGPLEVLEEDRLVAVGGVKLRALLVVLILHANETVSSERLIDELWGERPPANATKAVQVQISRLRRALDAARQGAGKSVVTREHGYYLRASPESIDSIRFERLLNEGRGELAAGRAERAVSVLEAGLSLWRGPPLADFVYEPFARSEIARLGDLRIAALEELVEAKLALGRHAEVMGVLETLIGENPYRERLRGQLMLALYRSERQAEALQAYQDARKTLVHDLGIEPGERLRELERGILAQDPALAILVDSGVAAEAVPEGRSAPFIGRDYEFGELLVALGDASTGHGRLVLLGGEPGIGKTRLVEELIAHARARGVRTLVGRCWEAGGAPPYWPWVQSLRAFLRDSDVATLRAQLAAGAAELSQILPELQRQLPDLPQPAETASEGARFRLFDATADFLRAASGNQPMLLFLDDLHAADASSLLLLRFLARELGSMRVLVVAAYRDVDPTPEPALAKTLSDVAREPVTRRYALGGWARREVAECIENAASGLASAELVAALHEQTGGNPLFIGEIVRLLAIEGLPARTAGDGRLAVPESVREVIARRMSHLSVECSGMLVLASVIGREFALDELAHAGSVSQDELLDVLDEAMAARVLSEVRGAPGHLRFAHALLRDTLYDGLTGVRRIRLHRRIVDTLERLYGEDPGPHLAELAHHSIAANELDKASDYARRAADRAQALVAYDEATRFYEMALAALEFRDPPAPARERVELARRAAEAANLAGDRNRAARLIRSVLPAVDPGVDPELVGLLHERLGRYLWAAGDSESALIAYDEAVALVPSNTPSHARARTLAASGQALMLMARYRESLAVCEAANAMAVGLGARAEQGHALNTLGLDLAYLGDIDAGVSRLLEARRIAEEIGDRDDIGRAYLNLSHLFAVAADRPDEALQIALEGIEDARRLGLARDYGVSLQANAASALVAIGRWRDADEMLVQAEELHPDEIARADLLHARLELLVPSGRDDAAEDDLDELRGYCAQVVDPQHHAPLCARIAELALWHGDPETAGAAVVTGLGFLEETDDMHYVGPLLSLGMRAAADAHDGATGARLLERARSLADGTAPLPQGTAAHTALCEAEAARLANKLDAQAWRAARRAWEALRRPYPAAYSAWREAEMLLAHGRQRASAEAALRYSHRVARELGAAPLLAELELLGERVRVELRRIHAGR
jgi:DNA-binding SARP family transcriptional activator